MPFRDVAPEAWTLHRATCRWSFNAAHPGLDDPEPPEEHAEAAFISLPVADPAAPGAIQRLVGSRFSCRTFTGEPVELVDVAALARAGYGVLGHASVGSLLLPERPVPSGGGMYPLELYFLVRAGGGLPPGVHHFHPHAGGLEHVRAVSLPARYLSYLFMNQYWFAEAAVIAVLTGVVRRTARKYGDRGYRYMLLEAGHVAQNLTLAAAGLGLGSCCGGGFYDDELADLLTADVEHEVPLYAIAIGHPPEEPRAALRSGLAGGAIPQ